MKNSFSSAVNESLRGRGEVRENSEKRAADHSDDVGQAAKTRSRISVREPQQQNSAAAQQYPEKRQPQQEKEISLQTSPLLKADGTPRKSKAGRKPKAVSEKKVQLTLTISRQCQEQLQSWADRKPRSAPNYLSEYVEEHLDEIIKYYSK